MRLAPTSLPFFAALRAAPAFASVRWMLTTMAMALGLAMMFGVRPTEAFPTVATAATAATAAAAQAATAASTESAASPAGPDAVRRTSRDDPAAVRVDRLRDAR